MNEPVNLMAGIQDQGKGNRKDAIVITSESLLFDPDDKAMAAAVAAAFVEQIKTNLARGQDPAGNALPHLAKDSIKRRRDEAEQGARGGQAADRYTDPKFRAEAQRNYTYDYTAPRLGTFVPRDGGPRGFVSGMLMKSFSARPSKDGKSVIIYVAAKRGRPRPTRTHRSMELRSALESTFRDVPLMTPQAMAQPKIRAAMQRAADNMLGKDRAVMNRRIAELTKQFAEAAENAEQLGDSE